VTELSVTAQTNVQLDDLVKDLLDAFPPGQVDDREFLGAQFDRGLARVDFPDGCGGLGLAPADHQYVLELLMAAGAPSSVRENPIGTGMVAPTIVAHGTDYQRARYLRPLFTGEEVWCQLYSEPGAGSDVAGLATRALRDGEQWVVSGQKVWTTLAHRASFGLLLARNDPDVPKHRGMICLLVDMAAPGVEVRPLFQITGEAEFNEVFFTDVLVPDSDRLGDPGQGWAVAMTTLMNERISIGGIFESGDDGPVAQACAMWRQRFGHEKSARAAVLRDRVMRAWVEQEVIGFTNLRATEMRSGGDPGPIGSVAKLAFAEANKRACELTVDLMGAEGMGYVSTFPRIRPEHMGIGGLDPREAFLRSRANSIEGGTSEILRNVLGERVLGLPGEPRVDKDLPWSQTARS
jgi:alkylation response protein AidB-like acyl-CoA dehydrogenase